MTEELLTPELRGERVKSLEAAVGVAVSLLRDEDLVLLWQYVNMVGPMDWADAVVGGIVSTIHRTRAELGRVGLEFPPTRRAR